MNEIEFVHSALYSLNFCAVRASDYLWQWFVPAFNDWYAPLQGSFRVTLATVLDFGLQVVEPGVGFRDLPSAEHMVVGRFQEYQEHLKSLHDQPLMRRARRIWDTAKQSHRPGASEEVGRLLCRALLDGLESACPAADRFQEVREDLHQWDAQEQEHLKQCPRCAKIEADRVGEREHWEQRLHDIDPFFDYPFVRLADAGRIEILVEDWHGERRLGEMALEIPAFDPAKPYPAFLLPGDDHVEAVNRVPLFYAHAACHVPGVEDELDGKVVEACIEAQDQEVTEYEPPKLYNTVLEDRTKSRLPGSIAGLTRIETKTDTDSLMDVVPSELALMLHNETAGLQKLLEKPLIYKREREQDQVPKHRALVCFLVESGDLRQRKATQVARYPAYVYAKRQSFDLIRDLREALEKLRNRTQVELDVAVFVLRAYQSDAVVHRLFRLDRLTPRRVPDERLDRFDQMLSFSALLPGFFNFDVIRRASAGTAPTDDSYEIIDPQVERFLQRNPQRIAPYHAEHIVAIGSVERLMEFVPATIHDAPSVATVQRRVMLIAVDPQDQDPTSKLVGEPAWSCVVARTLREAAQRLNKELSAKPIHDLREGFLEMILGDTAASKKHRRLVQYNP